MTAAESASLLEGTADRDHLIVTIPCLSAWGETSGVQSIGTVQPTGTIQTPWLPSAARLRPEPPARADQCPGHQRPQSGGCGCGLVPTSRSGGLRLCHGDLHPGNVRLGLRSPVVVDWFTFHEAIHWATSHERCCCWAVAVLIRCRISLRAPAGVLPAVHDAYFHAICTLLDVRESDLEAWHKVEAVAQVGEARLGSTDGFVEPARTRRC